MVSDGQHMLDAFAEKNRAESQLHEALIAQARLGRPASEAEKDTLETLRATADNAYKLWIASWPVEES